MSDRAEKPAALRRGVNSGEIISYGLIIGAIVLACQIAMQPLMQRAPVEVAIRLAPTSPLVLRRAAESELAADRVENAAVLSREALARSPFDVRALRVLGLAEARAGREDQADEMLTLAGNWSLRDDPAHAWLVERRLRRGDYASSFAHADTLVRRRQDVQPQVFGLFTAAGAADAKRALPVIARLLSARPPWRGAYLNSLNTTAEGIQLAANLAVMLEAGRSPLTSEELQNLYWTLSSKRQWQALSVIRERMNRPPPGVAVTNGGWSDTEAPAPFQWRLYQKAGIVAEIAADDLRPANSALRVNYDGYATGPVAEQLTSLSPGVYRISAAVRTETGDPAARLAWVLRCVDGSESFASIPAGVSGVVSDAWTTMSGQLVVPDNCPAQWLRLETRADDRRVPTIAWFDQVSISPAA